MRALRLQLALAVTLLAVPAAQAQVPERYGFFGHIDGRWMWLGGEQVGSQSASTNGPGGQMLLGFKWSPEWDVALAGGIQSLITEVTKFRNGTLSVDTRYQHVDLELGYSQDWWRANFGLRGIHYKQGANYNVPGFAGYDQREMYGIGPKVGVGARLGLSDDWAVIGGADAALVYTSFQDTGSGVLVNGSTVWGFVPQLGGELGVNWRSPETPSFSVTVGGRVLASFNTAITGDTTRRGTLVDYGPFIRVAYNFGGARRGVRTASDAAPAPSPNQPAHSVHFAFGSAHISPVAAGTLQQVADDARRGRPANVLINGFEGSARHDDALAVRRAEAIRAELVRDGLSLDQVSIAPHGDGQPLTALADGTPNRRVRITY